MWTLCSTLDKQLDSALAQFNKWGVDFIMTDFMDRDDQPMVNFYHRIAKACADHEDHDHVSWRLSAEGI